MKKKKAIIAVIFLIAVAAIAIKIFGNTQAITQKDLDDSENAITMKNISQVMLNDTGRTGEVKNDDIKSITVKYGDINGDSSVDAVICADYGDNYSLVAAYKKDGDVYTYINEIGVFNNVLQMELTELDNLNRDAVFIQERINNKIGCYDEDIYLKGYVYDDKLKSFEEVLDYPINVSSDWNVEWDDESNKSSWHKIVQKTKAKLENGKVPKISMEHDQRLYVSTDTQAKNIPESDTYKLQNKRTVKEDYVWSDKWKRFILDEKVDKTNGKDVAAVLYWGRMPYALDNKFGRYKDYVEIVKDDSSKSIIRSDMLSDVKNTFVYTSADV
ncbi:MAG: hypothetical protein LKJ25_09455 [Clostridia bacterium]|nr:hypothetical protein [Clostridia bacterium]